MSRPALRRPGGRPLVIAHRGASARQPENTLAAFALAIEQGADMIETDLHATRDGVIVLVHDAELERIGGTGEIGDHDFARLRTLDAGSGERVPSLDEVLDAFGSRVPFNLEIKTGLEGRRYAGIEQRALDAVRRRGLLESTLFSCFDDAVLHALREAEPAVRLGVLIPARRPQGALERAAACAAEAVHPFFARVDAGLVARAHERGLAVLPYTVDEPDWMERLLDLGVDGLFTNHPDRLRALIAAREAGERGCAPRA